MTRRADINRSDFVRCRSRSRKLTSQMTRTELARVVAEHREYLTGPGGWIYTSSGLIVCQGYAELGRRLEAEGTVVVGRGVNWPRPRVAR